MEGSGRKIRYHEKFMQEINIFPTPSEEASRSFPWCTFTVCMIVIGFPGYSAVRNLFACHAGDEGSVPGSGRSPGEGHGHPVQYSCLENPMDRGAWWATVPRVAEWHDWSDWAYRHDSHGDFSKSNAAAAATWSQFCPGDSNKRTLSGAP